MRYLGNVKHLFSNDGKSHTVPRFFRDRKKSFDELYVEAVELTLRNIFGNVAQEAVISLLCELKEMLPKELMRSPEALADSLTLLFGDDGAKVIMCSIINQLCNLIGIRVSFSGSFPETINKARLRYEYDLSEDRLMYILP